MKRIVCQSLLVVADSYSPVQLIFQLQFEIFHHSFSFSSCFFLFFCWYILTGKFPSTICQCVDFSHPIYIIYLYHFHSSDYCFFFNLEVYCALELCMCSVVTPLYMCGPLSKIALWKTHFICGSNCHSIWSLYCVWKFVFMFFHQYNMLSGWGLQNNFTRALLLLLLLSFVLYFHYVTACHSW